MLQSTALGLLKSGQNVFLTGSAGTGKTYVLNQYIAYLREQGVPVAITASTGIAATHLGGQTIHSWSGLGIAEEVTENHIEKLLKKKPVRQRIERTKVLIIDEISMLSLTHLHCIDQILRCVRRQDHPFGGLQVILCGDFFQLPPVSTEREPSYQRLAFMAPVWVELDLQVCYLTEQFRTGDDDLIRLLNDIRTGEVSDINQDLLVEKLTDSQEKNAEGIIRLFTHNADVENENQEHLEKLDGFSYDYYSSSRGSTTVIDSLRKSVLAPDTLSLKKGAQVMFVKNNPDLGYMNGTLGTVVDISSDEWPIVTTLDSTTYTVKPETWQVLDEMGELRGSYSQLPLRLAWAITIHKSQGMSLDAAVIDLSKTFETGQGYVALSRVRSWEGLILKGANQKALSMDELVMRADQRFQELSEQTELGWQALDQKVQDQLHQQFLFQSGGLI